MACCVTEGFGVVIGTGVTVSEAESAWRGLQIACIAHDRASGLGRYAQPVPDAVVQAGSYAAYGQQFFGTPKRPVCLPMGDDPARENGADARQAPEFDRRRSIEIDQTGIGLNAGSVDVPVPEAVRPPEAGVDQIPEGPEHQDGREQPGAVALGAGEVWHVRSRGGGFAPWETYPKSIQVNRSRHSRPGPNASMPVAVSIQTCSCWTSWRLRSDRTRIASASVNAPDTANVT